ncbi:unnamed protein product, partial [Brassica rapa subsp. trilocularis]
LKAGGDLNQKDEIGHLLEFSLTWNQIRTIGTVMPSGLFETLMMFFIIFSARKSFKTMTKLSPNHNIL